MSGSWASLTSGQQAMWVGVCVFVIAVAAIIFFVVRNYLGQRPSPEELERRRRAAVHKDGKMGDGEIIDVETASVSIVYSYSIAGVVYTASQDVVALRATLPQDLMTMIGPVSIKFDPRNPANSIVLCEEWSGLRRADRKARPAAAKS